MRRKFKEPGINLVFSFAANTMSYLLQYAGDVIFYCNLLCMKAVSLYEDFF